MFSKEFTAFLNGLGMFGWRLGLDNIRTIVHDLGNPHQRFACIHIAGSNGKGSVAHMLEAVYRQAGFRTGLYTSPHLLSPAERVRIGGQALADDEFERGMSRIRPVLERHRATYFEAMTAFAFQRFAEASVDLAIIETGLGGRLDATNIVAPLLSIITSISLEHQAWLGNTLAAIAAEKAEIIKPGAACVVGELPQEALAVVAEKCRRTGVPLLRAPELCRAGEVTQTRAGSRFRLHCTEWPEIDELVLGLHGRHQVRNAAVAVQALENLRRQFPVSAQDVRAGMEKVHIAGRFHFPRSKPGLLLDVAHNPESMQAFAETVQEVFPGKSFRILLGVLADKDAAEVLSALAPITQQLCCVTPSSDRALPAAKLAEAARMVGLPVAGTGEVEAILAEEWGSVDEENMLIVTGSHFLVAEVLAMLQKQDFGSTSV